VQGVLEMRKGTTTTDWIFPAPTASGHIEALTLKKQHAAALDICGVEAFVLYARRHTCLTRWAKYMDPFIHHVLAGHTDMNWSHPPGSNWRPADYESAAAAILPIRPSLYKSVSTPSL
jgi:hypothetical protein